MNAAGRLICLAGVSGAGKDTAGEYLVTRHGFQRVAFADPMKEVMMHLFELSREQLWGNFRNVPDARLGRSPRELYQKFGQACIDLDPDVWIRQFQKRTVAILSAGGDVVCTDARMPAELRALKQMGAAIWKLERTGAGAPGQMRTHQTETALEDEPAATFDRTIRNHGTVGALHEQLEHALGCT